MTAWLEAATLATALPLVHHVLVHPLAMAALGRGARPATPPPPAAPPPEVSIILPACDEAAHIAAKLKAIAALDHPRDRLETLVLCDGCRDDTVARAEAALAEPWAVGLRVRIIAFARNRGKVAMINHGLARCSGEIVLLTDVSAELPADLLARALPWFADPTVGVALPGYALPADAGAGAQAHRALDDAQRRGEARLGGPIGAHGAAYLVRRALAAPLPPDTVNDDFVLPAAALIAGARVVHLPDLRSVERARDRPGTEFRRRRRIARGNLQQAWRLRALADPRRPGLAYIFLAGKALRALAPVLALLLAAEIAALAALGVGWAMAAAAAGLGLACAAGVGALLPADRRPRTLAIAAHLVQFAAAGLLGAADLARKSARAPWRRAESPEGEPA